MIADPRSEAFVENFTGQWLNVRGMQASEPVVDLFPDFDSTLRQAFRREIELFFGSVIHEDRSILDLLTADYTFVNERLAKHYGIPTFTERRRTRPWDRVDMRRGRSARRAGDAPSTRPVVAVKRGKVSGNVLDSALRSAPASKRPEGFAGDAQNAACAARAHRANECAACHQSFEPMGLARRTGRRRAWRTLDAGQPIDPRRHERRPSSAVSREPRDFALRTAMFRHPTRDGSTYALGLVLDTRTCVPSITHELPRRLRFSSC